MEYLDLLQKMNDILYTIFGDKGFVIDIQVFINGKRFENDKVDKKEVVYMESTKVNEADMVLNDDYEYVQ